MNYEETLAFLFSQLPMFQRQGPVAYKKDLGNIRQLCAALNHPEHQFKSVHIAGTNGKGSVSHIMASVLQESGYRVGLYTSPHLMDFRERIRVNGVKIPENTITRFVDQHQDLIQRIQPSFFEITVAMAFDHFAEEAVDVAVIETGLGGRLDSTNIIHPELCVITNIGWDHSDMLGATLAKIAAEKAGIIKPGVPVVIGEYGNESFPVFSAYADVQSSTLIRAWESQEQLPNSDLKGPYQTANRRTALVAIRELMHGGWSIPESAIISGFEQVISNTGLMGRWQTIAEHPRIICDTGHNKDGIAYIVQQLRQESFQSLRMVFGQVAGKDPQAVLSMLPTHAEYYFCEPSVPRKLDVTTLMEEAQHHHLKGRAFLSVQAAYEQALADSHADDLIFVGGSTFVVADLLTYLNHTDPVG